MARSRIRLELDGRAVKTLAQNTNRETSERGAARAKELIQQEIKAAGRMDRYRMYHSVGVHRQRASGSQFSAWVGPNVPYARWQNDGTGPIYPRRAKFLRFKPKGSNTFVFAKRTKGVPAARFMEKAARRISTKDFLGGGRRRR